MTFLDLPERMKRNRTYGLTSVVDFGIPLKQLEMYLDEYDSFIDIAKFGIGAAYITPNLQKKIDLYKQHDIKPYFGGTLFEKFYSQNKISDYVTYMQRLGIEWVEVSTGTIDIPIEKRLDLIAQLKKDFHIIAEVGSKDSNRFMSISEWKEEIALLLEAGAKYVITEGRDSGTSGIYDQDGTVKSQLIKELVKEIDSKKIIFEAPVAKHQMYFINEIGTNVNLGNVKIPDVLVLEAQRCGLRCETFHLEASECKLPS